MMAAGRGSGEGLDEEADCSACTTSSAVGRSAGVGEGGGGVRVEWVTAYFHSTAG